MIRRLRWFATEFALALLASCGQRKKEAITTPSLCVIKAVVARAET